MLRVTFDDKAGKALVSDTLHRAKDTRPVMEDFAEYMVRSIHKNFEVGGRPTSWKPSRSEKTLQDSARLKNSVWQKSNTTSMQVGSNAKYGRIQHFGGVIKPVKAKALAIPLQDWIKGGPRRYKNLFFLEPEKGKPGTVGILARSIGGKGSEEVQPMFALRSSVKLPPRPWLLFQVEDREYVAKTLARYLKKGRLA